MGLETLTIRDGQSSAGTIDDVINLADEQIAEVIADAVNSDRSRVPRRRKSRFSTTISWIWWRGTRRAMSPIKPDLAAH